MFAPFAKCFQLCARPVVSAPTFVESSNLPSPVTCRPDTRHLEVAIALRGAPQIIMATRSRAHCGKSLSIRVLGHANETDCWHSTEAEVFDADGSLDTRQSLFTRRFVHAPLEKAFVRRTFPLGRKWVRVMLCFSMAYELGLLAHALACQCGIRWELAGRWYLRIVTMGTPFLLQALSLAFTYSPHCRPRILVYATVCVTLALALVILVPNSLAASDLTQEIVPEGGVVNAEIGVLKDYKNLLLQHTVVEFGVSLIGTLIFDAAGLSPPATILLNIVCIVLHVSLSDYAFSARFSSELSVARTWWQPTLSVVGTQIVQAYVVSALKRRVYLVQLLTAAHRIEQLSREKERAEWQQMLTVAKQRGDNPTSPNAAGESGAVLSLASGQSKESDAEDVSHLGEPTAKSVEGFRSLACLSSAGCSSSAGSELDALEHEAEEMAEQAAARAAAAAKGQGRGPRGRAAQLELKLELTPIAERGTNGPSLGAANTALPRASGSPGLGALRHDLLARRLNILTRKAAAARSTTAAPTEPDAASVSTARCAPAWLAGAGATAAEAAAQESGGDGGAAAVQRAPSPLRMRTFDEKGTPSSSPRKEGEPDPSAARSFAGTKWVAKPGGPQRRPLHPLRRPPPPPEEEEEEPPPPDPLATFTREAPAASLPSPRLRGGGSHQRERSADAAASGAGAAASHSGRSAPPSSDAGRSHASAESKDTADELLDIFLDPSPPPNRLVRFYHPLVAYAYVIRYGRRIPGPMPGSMPSQGREPPV